MLTEIHQSRTTTCCKVENNPCLQQRPLIHCIRQYNVHFCCWVLKMINGYNDKKCQDSTHIELVIHKTTSIIPITTNPYPSRQIQEHISATQLVNFSSLFPPLMRPASTPPLKQINVGIIATFMRLETTSQLSPSTSNVTNLLPPLP
mmetsp:Transcript_29117/g.61486  ORF Transcript_29117/g.61486 Transcript_29117/m.61486 type:complete len:147 (-) Transcript_29117:539-979(-)